MNKDQKNLILKKLVELSDKIDLDYATLDVRDDVGADIEDIIAIVRATPTSK